MNDYYFCSGCNKMIEAGGHNRCRCNDSGQDEDRAYDQYRDNQIMDSIGDSYDK